MEDFVFERHLKEFNTSQECEDYIEENEIEGPYVYYVKDTEVIYCPNKKIELVDMGLPSGTLWATDVIKNSDGEPLYFAWGEVSGYTVDQLGVDKNFNDDDYVYYCNGCDSMYTKYNENDGLTDLESEDDAATQILGENYQIPSPEHWFELLDNCYIDFISRDESEDNPSYLRLTSIINGNELILNRCGTCYEGHYENYIDGGGYYSWFFTYQTNKLFNNNEYPYTITYPSNSEYSIFNFELRQHDGWTLIGCGTGRSHSSVLYRYHGVPIIPIKKGNYVPQIPPEQ